MILKFADWFVYGIVGLDPETHLGQALNFFVYDTIKILFLLFLVSTIMGVINAYFPIQRLRHFLTTRKLYGLQYLFAAVFGSITPFCSCSSVPLFIGFVKGGIPLGVTFSYLITSPLVNQIAVAMFLGAFGWKATLTYLFSSILMGTFGGWLLGKMRLEPLLTDWVLALQRQSEREAAEWQEQNLSFWKRLPQICRDSWGITRGVVPYVLIGIGIGAAMHGYVPENFFEHWLRKDNLFAVPAAVIAAVPIYANAAAIVPVIQVFVAKGIPLGTALAFMMAVVGLSLPEAMMLKKVMTLKLIGIFFATVTSFIIILGYFFNLIL